VKRSSVFYWLLGIMIATVAITTALYFDTAVSDFLVHHRNRALYNFTYYVTLFGDWPEHMALGLILAWIAWRRGNRKWRRIFLSMVIALAIAGVSAHVIKIAVSRARPSVKIRTSRTLVAFQFALSRVSIGSRCCVDGILWGSNARKLANRSSVSANRNLDWLFATVP
jgi:hypothetical protein